LAKNAEDYAVADELLEDYENKQGAEAQERIQAEEEAKQKA
jgi:hypothetical protein